MRGNRRARTSICTLVLVRHAPSHGAGKFIGQQDEPLSTAGQQQLRELVRKLGRFRFHAVFTSDLTRAIETARPVAERQQLELQIRPDLREMDFGRWQGLSWRQIRRRDPRAADRWLKHFVSQPIPGGERFRQFKRRIKRGLKTIVGANRGRCVLVVTHAGVIRVALADALGVKDENIFRLAQDHCALNVVEYSSGSPTVTCLNA
jgi:alpha-ribazole phosphatase